MENDDRTFGYPIFSRIAYNMRFSSLFILPQRILLLPCFGSPFVKGLQGFCVYNACGGGTGSGLGCLMLERLSVALLVIFDSFVFGQPMGPWGIYQGKPTIWGIYKVNTSFGESIIYKVNPENL